MPPKRKNINKWAQATKTWDTIIAKYADEEVVYSDSALRGSV